MKRNSNSEASNSGASNSGETTSALKKIRRSSQHQQTASDNNDDGVDDDDGGDDGQRVVNIVLHREIIMRKEMKRIPAVRTIYRYRVKSGADSEARGVECLTQIRRIFQQIVEEIKGENESSPNVKILLCLSSDTLHFPITVPLRSVASLSTSRILARADRVMMSRQEFAMTESFFVDVTVIVPTNLVGGPRLGRHRVGKGIMSLDEFLQRKTSVVQLKNVSNDNCFPYAVILNVLRFENLNKYKQLKDVQQHCPCEELEELARKLCVEAGHQFNTMVDLFKEGQSFQDAVNQMYSKKYYKLIVWNNVTLKYEPIFQGLTPIIDDVASADDDADDSAAVENLYFLALENHISILKSPSALLSSNNATLCNKCLTIKWMKHSTCKCVNAAVYCKFCKVSTKCPTFKDAECEFINCRDCNRFFANDECYENHRTIKFKGSVVCDKLKKCPSCKVLIVTTKKLSLQTHICTYYECTICSEMVPPNHMCYIPKLSEECNNRDLEESSKYSMVFFDVECYSETDTHIHRPCLVVASMCCMGCWKTNPFPHSDNAESEQICIRCQAQRKVVFTGRKCVRDFLLWLVRPGSNPHKLVYAHNFGNYDSYLLLHECFREHIIPEAVFRATRMLYGKIGKTIRLRDSLNKHAMCTKTAASTLWTKQSRSRG